MMPNLFKLAWRSLIRDLQFTFLNLIGLSIGLACALLIWLWVNNEIQINKYNENDNRIYQVVQVPKDGNEAIENTPGLLAAALSNEIPEVEYAAAVIPPGWFSKKGLFSFNDTHIRADGQFVSQDYFKIFSCHFIEGNKGVLFSDKNNIVLSDQLAIKLFGTAINVIGRVIEWNQEGFNEKYIVTGVFQKFSSNATIQPDAMFNYDQFFEKRSQLSRWDNNDPNTYLLVKKGIDIAKLNKKIAGFVKTKNEKSSEILFAQRFSDRYLYNRFENGLPSGGRIEYVKLFSIIGIFILLIACINFMNLSTSKAMQKIKAIGIQKMMGANRWSLVVQYLSESLLMAFLSLVVAILVVLILLPAFQQITGKNFIIHFTGSFVLAILMITFFTGIVAGSYPALYLSGFKSTMVLKNNLKQSSSEMVVRKGLVVFQFASSVILIISVLVVYQQMHLIQTKNIGYNRDHVIYFDMGGRLSDNKDDYKPGAVYNNLATLIQQIKMVPGVVNASNFRHSIVNRDGGTNDVTWPGKLPGDQASFTDIAGGYDFIETLGITLKEGRTYSRAYGSDNDKVIFNEAAIKTMGLTDPIGKTVTIWGNKKQIIGVTKDFNFQSLYENIKPCFFDLSMNQRVAKIIVRIKAGAEKATIDRLSELYKENVGEILDYKFLESDYQAVYSSEERVAALSKYFAGIAILTSCLGIFGLAAFTAQRRKKEIGIRKVIGASVSNVVFMLSKDFLFLVSLSLVIALPLAGWLVNQWLQNFVYRVAINPLVFIITGVFIIVITLVTVSFQTIKAASANPVNSLRTE